MKYTYKALDIVALPLRALDDAVDGCRSEQSPLYPDNADTFGNLDTLLQQAEAALAAASAYRDAVLKLKALEPCWSCDATGTRWVNADPQGEQFYGHIDIDCGACDGVGFITPTTDSTETHSLSGRLGASGMRDSCAD